MGKELPVSYHLVAGRSSRGLGQQYFSCGFPLTLFIFNLPSSLSKYNLLYSISPCTISTQNKPCTALQTLILPLPSGKPVLLEADILFFSVEIFLNQNTFLHLNNILNYRKGSWVGLFNASSGLLIFSAPLFLHSICFNQITFMAFKHLPNNLTCSSQLSLLAFYDLCLLYELPELQIPLLFDLQFPGTHSISKYATSNIISLDFTLPNLSSLHIEYVCKFSDPHYFPTCSHACTQPRENHNTNILIFPLQFLLFLIC